MNHDDIKMACQFLFVMCFALPLSAAIGWFGAAALLRVKESKHGPWILLIAVCAVGAYGFYDCTPFWI